MRGRSAHFVPRHGSWLMAHGSAWRLAVMGAAVTSPDEWGEARTVAGRLARRLVPSREIPDFVASMVALLWEEHVKAQKRGQAVRSLPGLMRTLCRTRARNLLRDRARRQRRECRLSDLPAEPIGKSEDFPLGYTETIVELLSRGEVPAAAANPTAECRGGGGGQSRLRRAR